MPLLAGAAGEVVDGTALAYLLQQTFPVKNEIKEAWRVGGRAGRAAGVERLTSQQDARLSAVVREWVELVARRRKSREEMALPSRSSASSGPSVSRKKRKKRRRRRGRMVLRCLGVA